MAVNTVWSVVKMEVRPEVNGNKNVVSVVHWRVDSTDGDYAGYIYGAAGVELDPQAAFTAYEDLVEDEVIGWVKDILGDEAVAGYESSSLSQLADQKNPPVVTPALPWSR
jgi:hypothetical protein